MTFYTLSFGNGLKRNGKRLSHLVMDVNTKRTVCGREVGNQGALWACGDGMFIPSKNIVSTYATQRKAVEWHITCKNCLAIHAKGKVSV
jgi:hypothetical protein